MRTLLRAFASLCVFSTAATAQLPSAPVPPQNPITEAKRILGKALFWDEQLSSEDTVACGTCHRPNAGGADPNANLLSSIHPGPDGIFGNGDDKRASAGIIHQNVVGEYVPDTAFNFAKQVTERASPSFIGAGHFPLLFWDGRAESTFLNP